jgi:hypothetical protein
MGDDVGEFQAIVLGLAPSIGIGFLFYKVIRLLLEADRRERLAHSRWEAEQDRVARSQIAPPVS